MRELVEQLHFYFLNPFLQLIFFLVIAYVIMSWLFALGIVSHYNRYPALRQVYDALHSFVEPITKPFRRVIPNIGRLDLSVLFLLMAIAFIRDYAIPKLISFIPI